MMARSSSAFAPFPNLPIGTSLKPRADLGHSFSVGFGQGNGFQVRGVEPREGKDARWKMSGLVLDSIETDSNRITGYLLAPLRPPPVPVGRPACFPDTGADAA